MFLKTADFDTSTHLAYLRYELSFDWLIVAR